MKAAAMRAAAAASALAVLTAAALALQGAQRERTLAAFSTSLEGRSEEQLHNIRLAARRLDGTLVPPGQEFSLAAALGPPGADRGWREAPAFVAGEVEQAAAGGICQVSSTLYNAALLAGLRITERHPHSRPVASVPPGRDAAVAHGVADLKFLNCRRWPVRIRASADGMRLTVRISGAGPSPPQARLRVAAARTAGRLVVTVWRQEPGRPEVLVSRDEYRLGP